MKNFQLNKLALRFKEEPTDDNFWALYQEVTTRWTEANVISKLANKYKLDFSEVKTAVEEKIYLVAEKYEIEKGNFYNLLSASVSNACIDLQRYCERINRNTISIETDEYDDYSLLNLLPHANAEDKIIEYLQKESDQRQLITNLVANAPEKCRQALEALAKYDFSYTDAAKHLNTSYPAVKRRVEKLSEYFSEEKYGHLYDYYTVAV